MSVPRFHVPRASAVGGNIPLPEVEAHHLRNVLRLKEGTPVHVFDGEGREWAGHVSVVKRSVVQVAIERAVTPAAEPPVHVTLCVGILARDQMDAVMRDATMLGVAAIVPVISSHVAVGKGATRNASAITRWQRVAVSSAKQCGRAVVPEVLPATPFEDVLADAVRGDLLMCVEPALASDAATPETPRPDAARLLIGPEGGWSPEEVAAARRHGAVTLSLGPRRLRAETAPVVALTALWTRWGW